MSEDVRDAYDLWSKHYDSDLNKTRDLDEMIMKQYLRDKRFDSILELGSGTGKNSSHFLEHTDFLLSVDFSEKMMAEAKAKIRSPKAKYHQFDICQPWNFSKEKFDLISFSLILEHIKDLGFIFNESRKFLNESGRVIVSEFHPFKQYQGSQAKFEEDDSIVKIPAFVHHLSEYFEVAKSAGFQLIDWKEIGDDSSEEKIPRILFMEFVLNSGDNTEG